MRVAPCILNGLGWIAIGSSLLSIGLIRWVKVADHTPHVADSVNEPEFIKVG